MSSDFQTLVATRYVPTGAYIGQLIRPAATELTGDPRIPCYIGKGSRLAQADNDSITRAFIVGTDLSNRGQLSFPSVSPFVATLPAESNGDQSSSRLYTSTGKEVPQVSWIYQLSGSEKFGGYSQVVITDAAYDGTQTYFIDYQAVERGVVDPIPFDEIREVTKLSLQTDQDEFTEGEDFYLPSTFVAIQGDSSSNDIDSDGVYNTNTTGFAGNLSKPHGDATDGLAVASGATYSGKYDRAYSIEPETSGTEFGKLQTLIHEIGNDYTAHLAEGASVHPGGADATNVLSAGSLTLLGGSASALTVDNIVSLAADIEAKYLAHAANTSAHTNADDLNTWTAVNPTTLGAALRVALILRKAMESGSVDGDVLSLGHFNQLTDSGSNVIHGSASTQTIAAPVAAFVFQWVGYPTSPGWLFNASAAQNLQEPDFQADAGTTQVTVADPEGTGFPGASTGVGAFTGTVSVENGLQLDLAAFDLDKVDYSNSGTRDEWILEGNGAALIELDERYANTNQFLDQSDVLHPVIALANDLRAAYEAHRQLINDAGGDPVHGDGSDNVDLTNVLTAPVATDLATTIALLNDIKAKYNAHEVYTTNDVHEGSTAANAVSAANATDWSTAGTLANAIRTALIAHFADTSSKHSNADDVTSITVAAVGTGVISYADSHQWLGTRNRIYKLLVTAVNGTTDVDFEWFGYGEEEAVPVGHYTSGELSTVTDGSEITLDLGVKLSIDLGSSNFIVGEEYTIEFKAPRIWYTGKDDREYRLNVTASPAYPSSGVTLSYFTNTPEGGFGVNQQATLNPTAKSPYIVLSDNVILAVRNMGQTNSHDATSHSGGGDLHEFSITLDDTIDWSLKVKASETIAKADFKHDPTGVITGVFNSYYVNLFRAPLSDDGTSEFGIESVQNASGADITYSTVANTDIVYFTATVYNALTSAGATFSYFHKGAEPDPGQTYYLNGFYLRPDEFYDTPLLLVGKGQAETTLNPMGSENHLAMMADAAFDAAGLQAIYVIQVRDIDEDGTFTDVDYKRAIDAAEAKSGITDTIVLDNYTSLADHLNHLNKMNDPFEAKERLGWNGMPVGTLIGDVDTADTLVYTARKTLQVFGNNPAHGTRILVAPTYCKRTIQLVSGATQQVTLDGSFIAGSLAAMTAGFSDPGATILKNTLIGGWDEVEVFTDAENNILGAAGIIWFVDEGAGVYRIEESITVDKFADDFAEISAMTQKQYVTRILRSNMTTALTGFVPPSQQAALAQIRGVIVGTLTGLVARGVIARYQDAAGNDRKIDPQSDVLVAKDRNSKTQYNFLYAYWLRYPIKRMFGLFGVDTNELILNA